MKCCRFFDVSSPNSFPDYQPFLPASRLRSKTRRENRFPIIQDTSMISVNHRETFRVVAPLHSLVSNAGSPPLVLLIKRARDGSSGAGLDRGPGQNSPHFGVAFDAAFGHADVDQTAFSRFLVFEPIQRTQ